MPQCSARGPPLCCLLEAPSDEGNRRGAVKDDPLVISLAPSLDRQRAYEWPLGQAFLEAVLALLFEMMTVGALRERGGPRSAPSVNGGVITSVLMAQDVDICCTGTSVLLQRHGGLGADSCWSRLGSADRPIVISHWPACARLQARIIRQPQP